MTKVGFQVQKRVVMAVTAMCIMMSGCEDRFDSRGGNAPEEGKPVEVTLRIGLADEVDAYDLSATVASTSKADASDDKAAFNFDLQPSAQTRAGEGTSLKPEALYNLEIRQYDANGNYMKGEVAASTSTTIGSAITTTLTAATNCQLVLVAWGDGNKTRLGSGTLAAAQNTAVDASIIKDLNPTVQADMNKMPYMLHLKDVNVSSDGHIYSVDGEAIDVRLRLQRLAARLNVTWDYSVNIDGADYQMSQILLQSIPLNYNVIPAPDPTSNNTYPSLVDQYTTVQLTSEQIEKKSYSCWLPANVRGTNPASTLLTYRIKSNAPTGSTYIDFQASNGNNTKQKISYRVYLGGNDPRDYNLYCNTDYHYAVKFNHTALPNNDLRVTIIDPIRASESNSNLVPTANCFMVAPGGAFCFDPFAYQQNGVSITNSTLKGWADTNNEVGIASVKLLWQTRENGDVGDPVMGVVNAADDHTNIVDIKTNDNKEVSVSSPLTDKGQGRIYCRVAPNTAGGNGVIAAYNVKGEVIWSWHVWITDYNPDPTGSETVLSPSYKRKLKFRYNVPADQLPMMDRTLGAMAGYVDEIPATPLDKSKTNGLQYQWGRKDPFTSSYSADPIKKINSTIGDKPVKGMLNRYGPDGLSYIPIESMTGNQSYRNAYKQPHKKGLANRSWCSNMSSSFWGTAKTDFDPCPSGWKVPPKEAFAAFITDAGYTGGSKTIKGRNIKTIKSLDEDGGILGYFEGNQSGHQVYLRFTGYTGGDDFVFIGQWLGYWTTTRATIFTAKLNTNLNGWEHYYIGGDWYEQDAHSVRCIQER